MSDLSQERALMASAEVMIRDAMALISPAERMSALTDAFHSCPDSGAQVAFTMVLIARMAMAGGRP